MYYADLIRAGLILGGMAITTIITFWNKILNWAQESLFPWIEKKLPGLTDTVKEAFTWIDRNVAVPIRLLVKAAWNKLRNYLLKMTVEFEQRSSIQWVKKTTSWVSKKLDTSKPVIKKVIEEDVITWDDLPAEVRENWLINQEKRGKLDVTEVRDRQLEELDMSLAT